MPRGVRVWGFIAVFLTTAAYGHNNCPSFLLTTSFGVNGPLIATLQENGDLVYWHDGFTQNLGETALSPKRIVPQFSRSGTFDASSESTWDQVPTRLSSIPHQKDSGLFAVVSSKGALSLVLPGGGTLDVLLPGAPEVRGVSLLRDSIGNLSPSWLTSWERLHLLTNQSNPAMASELESAAPIHLFIATRTRLYRLTLRLANLTFFHPDVAETVRNGVTELEVNRKGVHAKWENSLLDAIETGKLAPKKRLLAPTSNPNLAVEFLKLEELYAADPRALADFQFIQSLSTDYLVAATENAQVVVIHTGTGKITQSVLFPGLTYLQSFSAHMHNGRVDIWAVNGIDKQLYRWTSEDVARRFKAIKDFPGSEPPKQVATVAAPVSQQFAPGVLANLRIVGNQLEAEQVLVLSGDGTIYGRVDKVKEVAPSADAPTQDWVALPSDAPIAD